MAIRRITVADLPTVFSMWDTYRAGAAEYAGDPGGNAATQRALTAMIADGSTIMLIDPVTKTMIVGRPIGSDAVVNLLITLRTGAAAVTAADNMLKQACTLAINAGKTTIRGDYRFPAGVDVTTTRAGRYFDSLTPPLVRSSSVVNGKTLLSYGCSPTALRSALLVRTP